MRIAETVGVVYVAKPADLQAGADGDSLKLANHGVALFLIQFAALTGDAVLTINSGATAGTKTTAETFNYRLASAAVANDGADLFGNWATSAALTLTAATYQNKLLEVEIEAGALTEGQPWVTLAFSDAADALNVAVVAVLGAARYQGAAQPTAI